MKKFLKKNKFIILAFMAVFILVFSFFSRTFGVKYESLDFKIGKVKANCLNVRCGPGTDYKKIGKLYNGDYIDVFAKYGNWYIIQTDSNLIGAVSGDYIEPVYDENERYAAKTNKKETEDKKDDQEVKVQNNTEQANAEAENLAMTEFANSFALTEEEQKFLDLINSNRNINGLKNLEVNEEVQNVARLKAKDLVENDYFAHTSETYGNMDNMLTTFSIKHVSVGENIAGNSNLARSSRGLDEFR